MEGWLAPSTLGELLFGETAPTGCQSWLGAREFALEEIRLLKGTDQVFFLQTCSTRRQPHQEPACRRLLTPPSSGRPPRPSRYARARAPSNLNLPGASRATPARLTMEAVRRLSLSPPPLIDR